MQCFCLYVGGFGSLFFFQNHFISSIAYKMFGFLLFFMNIIMMIID